LLKFLDFCVFTFLYVFVLRAGGGLFLFNGQATVSASRWMAHVSQTPLQAPSLFHSLLKGENCIFG